MYKYTIIKNIYIYIYIIYNTSVFIIILLRTVREAAGAAGVARRRLPDLLLVQSRVRWNYRNGLL